MQSISVMTRMNKQELYAVDEAAKIERRTRSQFIAKSAIDRANQLVMDKE